MEKSSKFSSLIQMVIKSLLAHNPALNIISRIFCFSSNKCQVTILVYYAFDDLVLCLSFAFMYVSSSTYRFCCQIFAGNGLEVASRSESWIRSLWYKYLHDEVKVITVTVSLLEHTIIKAACVKNMFMFSFNFFFAGESWNNLETTQSLLFRYDVNSWQLMLQSSCALSLGCIALMSLFFV